MSFRSLADERRGPLAPIEVELAPQSTSQLYVDLAGNIVGVFASTFVVLERDIPVQLILSFVDGTTLRAGGVVQFVRTSESDQLPGLGIALTEISDDDRAILWRFAAIVPPMLYDE